MRLTYRIVTSPDENGTILICCPSLPEVTTSADSEADVVATAADAIEEALLGRLAYGEPFPPSDPEGVTVEI